MIEVIVNDLMQTDYRYFLKEPVGKNFHLQFQPQLSPSEMLSLGVFGGKYMTDCVSEFPESWFKYAKFSVGSKNSDLNFFKVDASLPLKKWAEKGWLYQDDPRGWFQWYCRYYMGRRIETEDLRQIKRWIAIRRHVGAVKKNCRRNDLECRKKQRQALLHWAYDSRLI
tara:strand:+ start:1894 stop:2397 length:504 start_codon:yes stop_codon:yes gene_type:complete